MTVINSIADLRELARRRIPRAIFDTPTAVRTTNSRSTAISMTCTPSSCASG